MLKNEGVSSRHPHVGYGVVGPELAPAAMMSRRQWYQQGFQ